MPFSGGICPKNASSASKPPADAPIPTIGKRSDADAMRETTDWARVRTAGGRVADRRLRPCVTTRFSVAWDGGDFRLATMCSYLLLGECSHIVTISHKQSNKNG